MIAGVPPPGPTKLNRLHRPEGKGIPRQQPTHWMEDIVDEAKEMFYRQLEWIREFAKTPTGRAAFTQKLTDLQKYQRWMTPEGRAEMVAGRTVEEIAEIRNEMLRIEQEAASLMGLGNAALPG